MDNKATTKRMIGAVVLVLVAALLLAWLLKGKNQNQDVTGTEQLTENKPIIGFPGVEDPNAANNNGVLLDPNAAQNTNGAEQNLEGSTNQAAGLEVRPVVENGQVTTQVNGSLGAGEVKPFAASSSTSTEQATDSKKAATAETGSVGSVGVSSGSTASSSSVSVNASAKDHPKTETAEPKRSSAVIVNERPVPRADSEESMRERAAREAAAKKAAEAKAAAEKAAAEKSKELAAAKAADAKAAAKSEELAAGKTTSTAATAGGFAIQFMASADKAKAEAVAKPLAAESYKVAVAEAKVDGKAIYRVRLGGFASKEEAVAAQAKMKARYTQNPDVQNSIVTTQ